MKEFLRIMNIRSCVYIEFNVTVEEDVYDYFSERKKLFKLLTLTTYLKSAKIGAAYINYMYAYLLLNLTYTQFLNYRIPNLNTLDICNKSLNNIALK